jgi:hypothetical protein
MALALLIIVPCSAVLLICVVEFVLEERRWNQRLEELRRMNHARVLAQLEGRR